MVYLRRAGVDFCVQPLGGWEESPANTRGYIRAIKMMRDGKAIGSRRSLLLPDEGDHDLMGKTSFRPMGTQLIRLGKHFDKARALAFADVIHEGFHTQDIFEV